MKKLAIVLTLLIVLIAIILYKESRTHEAKYAKLSIGNIVYDVEIMDNIASREKGLSGRKSIPDNFGLLFVFERDVIPSFWMKEMNFPIDIIWINKDMRIVGVLKNLNPETYPKTFSPREKIRYVLEINPMKEEYGDVIGKSVVIVKK